jgi:flagellar biogenesis protein FliO
LDALKTEMAGAKPVPYIVHESAQARQERHIKRLIFALILSIAFAFASNAIWLLAWMQYDYKSQEVLTAGEWDANEKKEVLNVIGF